MRTYAFAAIAAIAVGQEIEVAGTTPFPDLVYKDLNTKGAMGEAKITIDDDNFFLMFWLGWENRYETGRYQSGTTWQNYAQWEEEAGTYGAMTCNLHKFDGKNTNWNREVDIHNYTGIQSIRNEDGGTAPAWNGFGEI